MLALTERRTPAKNGPDFRPTMIRGLFPSPLVVASYADVPGIAGICARVLDRERAGPGVIHSNDGGWQSATDFTSWCGSEGEALIDAVARMADSLTAWFDGTSLQRFSFDWQVTAWANVSRRGAANNAHHHAGGFWSAVFYADDGGSDETSGGAIEFLDPRGPLPMAHAPELKIVIDSCLTAGLVERVYPRTGMLLLFPSWIVHRVTRYGGTGTRVSVAMNLARPVNAAM